MNQQQANSAEQVLSGLFNQMQNNPSSDQLSILTAQLSRLKTLPDYAMSLFKLLFDPRCPSPIESFLISLLKDLLLDLKLRFPVTETGESN